jgi:Na+-driven multidrug efflux pump
VALYPQLWIRIFSDDAEVLATGSLYLHIVAPLYPLFGAGVTLYFASQGSGQVLKPVLAGTARLLFVVTGAALVMQFGGPLAAIFAVIAMGLAVFGGLTAWVVHKANWQRA